MSELVQLNISIVHVGWIHKSTVNKSKLQQKARQRNLLNPMILTST